MGKGCIARVLVRWIKGGKAPQVEGMVCMKTDMQKLASKYWVASEGTRKDM